MEEDKNLESLASGEEDESCEEESRPGSVKLAKGDSPEFRWYVAHVLTGHENKVKKTLKERIFNQSMQDQFSEIYVPEESVTSSVKGKKRTVKKKFFPGYILIKMIMNDRTWHLVKNTDKITGFISADKNRPAPISDDEANFLLGQAAEGFKNVRSGASFSEGDQVRVTEGPFASFVGVVENVNEKGKVRVQVSIFGRPTPVELDSNQIEKV